MALDMTEELHDRHEYLGHLITDLIQMSLQETVESFVMTGTRLVLTRWWGSHRPSRAYRHALCIVDQRRLLC